MYNFQLSSRQSFTWNKIEPDCKNIKGFLIHA